MRRDNKLAKIEKVVDDWLNKRSFIALDAAREWDAEIEALTRRNAELTAALKDIAEVFKVARAAPTPTESLHNPHIISFCRRCGALLP